MSFIPNDHPRAESLRLREQILEGVASGIVAASGPIAHGRGEAFDYLLGERTLECVAQDIQVAAAMLLEAAKPVISVNGNVAALAPKEVVDLSKAIPAPIEINIFYGSKLDDRRKRIAEVLERHGAENVLGLEPDAIVPALSSNRAHVDSRGIATSDLVLVMLEDGDRCQALRRWNKQVLSIDLNPFSRSATSSTLNICDNLIRALPLLSEQILELKTSKHAVLNLIKSFDVNDSHTKLMQAIMLRLSTFARNNQS